MAATVNGEHTESSTASVTTDIIRELQKNIRNITKKLSSMHKTDAIIAENAGVSLDELVAQRKINADQKASALKKPQLQQQLAQLEEQIEQYKKIDSHYSGIAQKQKDELSGSHAQELEKVRKSAQVEAQKAADAQLRGKLLVFSQFLRAAAAKRSEDEGAESDENKAFEGVLLLVYGGDQKAVESAVKIIDGSEEKAPSIDGDATSISYAQIKKTSIDHSPFQLEEAWVDSVAEANATASGSDPTLTNAGLTEVQSGQVNGLQAGEVPSSQPTLEASNAAADRWDSKPAAGGAENGALEDSYEVIPRPSDEVDIPDSQPTDAATSAASIIDINTEAPASTSWADQVPAYESSATATESYVEKSTPAASQTDGFQEVPGRSRGRGRGNHHRDDGEHRGRGRGRGRGGFGVRGRGDGEFRGRGGRGRGARGDGPPRS